MSIMLKKPFVAMLVVYFLANIPRGEADSDCEEKRRQALDNYVLGKYVPQCDDNGNYKTVQCWSDTNHCFCVDPETGEETSAPAKGDSINCNSTQSTPNTTNQ
ncbi:Saxiphilin like protein [Argiope bruennichi]|uniref:Saxiphilin like protein n=1 Tax=Argiope bruennichi TaxID=94029 RepID=A0A8T0EGV9_ARGBR|nr:Saxiphilin like protein [Argiope bruennichi]